jgi:proliferating cell nuclear antigen
MKLMDIDADTLNIPETEYDARVTMQSSEFSRIVRDLSQLGESVRIEVSKEGVRFASDGEAANGSVLLRQTDGSHITGNTIKPEETDGREKDDDDEVVEVDGDGEAGGSGSSSKKTKVKKEKGDDDVEMDEEEKNDDEGDFKPAEEDEGDGEEEQDKEEEDEDEEEGSGSKKRKKKACRFSTYLSFSCI